MCNCWLFYWHVITLQHSLSSAISLNCNQEAVSVLQHWGAWMKTWMLLSKDVLYLRDLQGNDCMGTPDWEPTAVIKLDRIIKPTTARLKTSTHTQTRTDVLRTQLETLHCPAASVNLITTTPLTIQLPWPNHYDYICSLLTLWPCRGDKSGDPNSAALFSLSR